MIDVVESCGDCSCSWRASSNHNIYVVRHNCCGIVFAYSVLLFGFAYKMLVPVKMNNMLAFLLILQLCGAKLSEGIFVGSFLSMSSTAVVCFWPLMILSLFSFMVALRILNKLHFFRFSSYQVVKFLAERNSNSALHGQVTIGTLIFQVGFELWKFECYIY